MSLSLSAALLFLVPVAERSPTIDLYQQEGDAVYVGTQKIVTAQVRIERRVIIRVPRRRPTQARQLGDIRSQSTPRSYKEKKIGKCLPMNNILGVQMSSGRNLDLITKDRLRIRARLEKKCQARSFYSGFYMEKSGDGRICVNRDVLHSRSGSKCEIDRFRQLIAE